MSAPDLIKRAPTCRREPPSGHKWAPSPFRIALPFHAGDAERALDLLKWITELGGKLRRECVLIYDKGIDESLMTEIDAWSVRAFGKAGQARIQIGKLGIPWPGGANHTFALLCHHMASYARPKPWLLLEPDMAPTRSNWLETLENEYDKAGKPFMGAWVEHYDLMNGGGVYPPDADRWVREFLDNNPIKQQAYDIVVAPEVVPFMHRANHLMPHIWTARGNGRPGGLGQGAPKWTEEMMNWVVDHNACLVHRCKDGTLLSLLRKRREEQLNWINKQTYA